MSHPLHDELLAMSERIQKLGKGGCGHLALALSRSLDDCEIWRSYGAVSLYAHWFAVHDGYILDHKGSRPVEEMRTLRMRYDPSEHVKFERIKPRELERALKRVNEWDRISREDVPRIYREVEAMASAIYDELP